MGSETTGSKDISVVANVAPTATDRPRPARKPRPQVPPATVILFVRHGTTPTTGQVLPGRAPGLHLADRGRADAEAVAERLATLTGTAATLTVAPAADPGPTPAPESQPPNGGAPRSRTARRPGPTKVAAVYASPLERAQETAAPIAARLGLEVVTEAGLIEMDFGEWTGAELKTLYKLPEWNAVQRYPSGFQFPGGEAFAAMRARMAATIAALCRRHPGEIIVCVSHADPIKTAVSDALGTHLDLFQRISISTCSITAISYSRTGPAVLAVNTTGGVGDLVPR